MVNITLTECYCTKLGIAMRHF